MVLVGLARLAWFVRRPRVLVGLVHGINHGWDRLVHHAATVELPGEFKVRTSGLIFNGQTAPSTGTYPRVVLRDS